MLFATPDDVARLQKDVETETKALTAAIGACIKAGKISPSDGAPSDPTIFRDWKLQVKRVTQYLNEEPDWLDANTQYDAGLRLQTELGPWHDRINAAGCKAPPKPAPSPKPHGQDWLGDYGMLVGLAIAAVVLHEAKGL